MQGTKENRVMRVRDREPHWLVRSQQLHFPFSRFPFRRQFPGKTFKSRFAWSARVHAILVASQCIGIHFKGAQPGGGGQIGPRGPVESARSSSTMEAWRNLEGLRVEEENSRVKWRRVRNSRAVALYDDGSFTHKSQCSATVLVACRNIRLLIFSIQQRTALSLLSPTAGCT